MPPRPRHNASDHSWKGRNAASLITARLTRNVRGQRIGREVAHLATDVDVDGRNKHCRSRADGRQDQRWCMSCFRPDRVRCGAYSKHRYRAGQMLRAAVVRNEGKQR